MRVHITPSRLSGSITPPASKSQCHRLVIAAALSQGTSTLSQLSLSQDISATMGCMRSLGAVIQGQQVTGIPRRGDASPLPALECGESGSTLRFLMPVALAVAGGGVFSGQGRLMQRPMEPYERLFQEKHIRLTRSGQTLTVQGRLTPGRYALRGDVSSQFITGLLFALPLLEGESELVLTTPLESAGYVDMTIDALSRFGFQVLPIPGGWRIPGNQRGHAAHVTAEGDWSQAAFWLAAEALGSPVTLSGMNDSSVQGDRVIRDYCRRLSGEGEVALDVSQCPDLAPALAAVAALRTGEVTRLVNAGRLRMKESDRIESITAALSRLGARVSAGADSITFTGVDRLTGGESESYRDHRIAMMLAIAATRAAGGVTVHGAECVAKSYPRFWADYAAAGGRIEEESE
jgi:3-phosphoshikimate 1-carboxyvinyltransferase